MSEIENEEQSKYKCPNCHGQHSAAYKGCTEFIKAKEVLKIKIEQKMSYAEALKKHKEVNQLQIEPEENARHSEEIEQVVSRQVKLI